MSITLNLRTQCTIRYNDNMIRYENEYEYDHKNTIPYQTLSVRVSMFVRDKRSMMKYYEKYLVNTLQQ